MSTARPAEMSRIRRFAVPALCVLAAGGYAAIFLAHHDVAMAIAGAAIMLAYGAVLVVFSRRSEVAALLRDTANDERHALINLRACALALYAVVTVAVVMTFVKRQPGYLGHCVRDPGGGLHRRHRAVLPARVTRPRATTRARARSGGNVGGRR